MAYPRRAALDLSGKIARRSRLARCRLPHQPLPEPKHSDKAGPRFPKLLWDFDPELGRTVFRWLGRPAPDERPPRARPQWSHRELDLKEVLDAIPNDLDWHGWNRIGLAIWNATQGSAARA